jgi:UDP-N-acetylglucosamine 2-epimerase
MDHWGRIPTQRAAVILETWPEAIELAPIVLEFDGDPDVKLLTCTTGEWSSLFLRTDGFVPILISS